MIDRTTKATRKLNKSFNIDIKEKVQMSATKSIRGLRNYSHEKFRMLKLDLLSKRRLGRNLIENFKIVRSFSGLRFEDFFQYAE